MRRTDQYGRFDEELVCTDSLVHCLKQRCKCQHVCVQRAEDDPPDFWVTVDGVLFAAEVTSIVNDVGYHARCEDLERSIERAAAQTGTFSGTYALSVYGHPEIPKDRSEQKTLIERAVSFIQDTSFAPTSARLCLIKSERRGRIDVVRVDPSGSVIGLVHHGGFKREIEVVRELRQQMQESIRRKQVGLKKKHVHAKCSGVLLLLYDAYAFGLGRHAQKALLGTEGYDWFHSIFWAASFTDRPNELSPENPGREGIFLYSSNAAWWSAPEEGQFITDGSDDRLDGNPC